MRYENFIILGLFTVFIAACSESETSPAVSRELALVNPPPGATGLHPNLTFEWEPVSGATQYRVLVEEPQSTQSVLTNTTSAQVPGLVYATSYKWKVEALDENDRQIVVSQVRNFITKVNFFKWRSFQITSLSQTVDIWIYLPPDYDDGTDRYPVLYMTHGEAAFRGNQNMMVDKHLDLAYQSSGFRLMVAAFNTEGVDPFTPWVSEGSFDPTTKGTGGKGDHRVKFIIEELKPAIDEEFRTLTGPEHTGMYGASLGGLLSFYAGIQYPDVFGRIASFSPSFYYVDDKMFELAARQAGMLGENKIYFWVGGREIWPQWSLDFPKDIERMTNILEMEGFTNYKVLLDPDGGHGDRWVEAFPPAILWLFN